MIVKSQVNGDKFLSEKDGKYFIVKKDTKFDFLIVRWKKNTL